MNLFKNLNLDLKEILISNIKNIRLISLRSHRLYLRVSVLYIKLNKLKIKKKECHSLILLNLIAKIKIIEIYLYSKHIYIYIYKFKILINQLHIYIYNHLSLVTFYSKSIDEADDVKHLCCS